MARQRQQQIERPLKAVDVDDEHRLIGGALELGAVEGKDFGGHAIEVLRKRDQRIEFSAGGGDIKWLWPAFCGKRGVGAAERLTAKLGHVAGNGAHLVELTVAREHDIAAGGDRVPAALGNRAIKSIHRDVITHQQTIESDKAANHLTDDCRRSCRRTGRIAGAEDDVCGHRHRQVGECPEGCKIDRLKLSARGVDHRQEVVGIDKGAAMARDVFQDRQHPAIAQGLQPRCARSR